jgi:histidine ammonia-lyase
MRERYELNPGQLRLADAARLRKDHSATIYLKESDAMEHSANLIATVVNGGERIYGVNTGFGKLATAEIGSQELSELQHRLVLSTAAGLGPLLPDDTVRLCMILKINTLAQGYSGVRPKVVKAFLHMLNENVYPCVPAKGSVGASGDLAPLAHLVAPLIGHGEVRIRGEIVPAEKGLASIGLAPIKLAAKEGLAFVNGTQVSTALSIEGLLSAEDVFLAGLVTGALSTEAIRGNLSPFDLRIHEVRRQKGQIDAAATFRRLFSGSSRKTSPRLQDPYSIRCQPQVMGACLDLIRFANDLLSRELAAVTDNPLIFHDSGEILSGGNFHAEPIAMASDILALAIAEIGALSERRIALLIDQHTSGLPPFLVADSGLNSGFMVAHVTAAALASENKSLAHPACVDSLPTSANQEDHVSMATFAARRLGEMADNTAGIIAIEMLCASQGIELNRFGIESPNLAPIFDAIRAVVPFLDKDRYISSDILAAKAIVASDFFRNIAGKNLVPSMTGETTS